MPSQGKQFSEYFTFFLELHKIGGVEDEKYRALTCYVFCWVTQNNPHPREKQDFQVSLRPWKVHEVGWLLVIYGLLVWYP